MALNAACAAVAMPNCLLNTPTAICFRVTAPVDAAVATADVPLAAINKSNAMALAVYAVDNFLTTLAADVATV